jgi:E3 SUMO-protein ligase RanBP2
VPTSGLNLFGTQTINTESPSFNSLANGNALNAKCFGNPDAATKSSDLKPFGFGGGLQPTSQPKQLFGSAVTSNTPNNNNNEDGDESHDNQNPEEYEPQVDFKPLVKLEEVEVKTGEEDEEILFKARCKLYRFNSDTKEWKEKGAGEIKVLSRKGAANVFRILMRRDQIFKLCANHRVTADLKLEAASEKQIRWHATDYSEPGDGNHELLTCKFRSEDDAKQFKSQVEKCQELLASQPTTAHTSETVAVSEKPKSDACAGLTPSLSDMFKKDNKWTCNGCYVNNSDDLLKCVACQTVRGDGKTPSNSGGVLLMTKSESDSGSGLKFGGAASAIAQSQSDNNFGIKFGSSQPIANAAPIIFGSTESNAANSSQKGSLFNFSSKSAFSGFPALPINSPSKPAATNSDTKQQTTVPPISFGAAPKTEFGQTVGLSFADLASATQPLGFGGGFKTNTQPNPSMLFGSQQQTNNTNKVNDGGEGDGDDSNHNNDNPEEYEPQVDFKPLVKLQEVEVKTGEEDEDVVFKARCKLYRFHRETKEWKEKGAGEIKILKRKSSENAAYRVLMRRDHTFKLCANHRITSDIKLEACSEKQLRWLANDCSEGATALPEYLTAKFRLEEDAKVFKAEFERAQEATSKNKTTSKSVIVKEEDKGTSNNINNLNSLASLLKITDGSWKCVGCLTLNKPDAKKCACCDQAKVDNNSNYTDEDFTIEKVIEATEEQKQKAKEFMLPENFYLYLNKPSCQGCIGCPHENDE